MQYMEVTCVRFLNVTAVLLKYVLRGLIKDIRMRDKFTEEFLDKHRYDPLFLYLQHYISGGKMTPYQAIEVLFNKLDKNEKVMKEIIEKYMQPNVKYSSEVLEHFTDYKKI